MNPKAKILADVTEAVRTSPAYRAFIQKALGSVPKHISARNFKRLPVTSKHTFAQKYPPRHLLMGGKTGEVAYASSGSSGESSLWFRDEQTLADGVRVHRLIFEQIYGIKPGEPTLVLVTFSLGMWIAGLFTADACRELRAQGFDITVATPGIDRQEGITALKRLGPLFKHVVIAGYPPYVLDFLREAFRDRAHVPPSAFVLTAGAGFSEEWRDEVAGLIKRPRALHRLIGLYGSADAGTMGFETPLTIAIRRRARTDQALCRDLFPGRTNLGGLYQFLPDAIYLESSGEELLVTKRMPIPLVRYNIHDTGRVYEPGTFKSAGIARARSSWQRLPVVSVNGRTDVAVTLYALNIYPEQVSAGILSTVSTGSYFIFTRKRRGAYSEQLVIDVELKNKIRSTRHLQRRMLKCMTATLTSMNTEFRKLYTEIGAAALPLVRLKKRGSLTATTQPSTGNTALLQVSGKKPRVVVSS